MFVSRDVIVALEGERRKGARKNEERSTRPRPAGQGSCAGRTCGRGALVRETRVRASTSPKVNWRSERRREQAADACPEGHALALLNPGL